MNKASKQQARQVVLRPDTKAKVGIGEGSIYARVRLAPVKSAKVQVGEGSIFAGVRT